MSSGPSKEPHALGLETLGPSAHQDPVEREPSRRGRGSRCLTEPRHECSPTASSIVSTSSR